eukprot:gene12352-25989_t
MVRYRLLTSLTSSDEKNGNRIQGDVEIRGENRLIVSVGSLAAPTESVGYGNTTTEGLGFGERREAPLESKGSDTLNGKVVGGIATLISVQKGSVAVDAQDERVREMGDDKCSSAVDPEVQTVKVLEFKKPENQKELKSFLGLAGYFRDHIRDYSIESRQLYKAVTPYCPGAEIIWTEGLLLELHWLRELIGKALKLYFMDKAAPI